MYYPLTLQELLNTCRNNVLRDLVDEFMWTDERIVQLLNEAYIEYAQATRLLRDAANYFVTLEEGESGYALPEEVLTVLSARATGATRDLRRVSRDQPPATDAGIVAFSIDEALRVFTVYGVPTAADEGAEVLLRVARLPRTLFTLTDTGAECELPRQFAMALPYGAAALAYLDQDADGGDPVRAATMRREFDRYISRGAAHTRLSMFAPVTFGFGGGGFSHT